MEAGLPNITGKVSNLPNYYGSSGCFYRDGGTEKYHLSGAEGSSASTYIDASRSSSIYGNSSTVTPLSLSSIFAIKY